MKIHREKKFLESISVDEDIEKKMVDLFSEINISSSYTGPEIKDDQPITTEWYAKRLRIGAYLVKGLLS